MPRRTRAAMRAQANADIHPDPDVDLDCDLTTTVTTPPTPPTTSSLSLNENDTLTEPATATPAEAILTPARPPLGEIATNAVDTLTAQELDPIDLKTGMVAMTGATKSRGKGKRKGKKAADTPAASESTPVQQTPLVRTEEVEAMDTPVRETRLTRRTRAMAKAEGTAVEGTPSVEVTMSEGPGETASDEVEPQREVPVVAVSSSADVVQDDPMQLEGDVVVEPVSKAGSDGQIADEVSIEEAKDIEPETTAKSDVALPVTDVAFYSPSGKPVLRPEDSIEALDDLEDAIEAIGQAIPNLEVRQAAPEKRRSLSGSPAARRSRPVSVAAATSTRSVTPAVKQPKAAVTKGPTATVRSTSTLVRSASTRAAPKPKAPVTSATKAPATLRSKPTTVAPPATKRRPVSMHFPPPPGPIKSTKPPTQPTFTLPGEAVAARLKAAREARLAAAAEEAKKKPAFKARPAPRTAGSSTMPVRKTTASMARESMIHGEGAAVETSRTVSAARPTSLGSGTFKANSLKRASVAGISIPPKPAAKPVKKPARPSYIAGVPATSITSTKRASTLLKTASTASSSATSTIAKRQSTLTRKPRPTSILRAPSSAAAAATAVVPKPTVTPSDLATQKVKGREIFNRDKVEKEERERLRREKEEAAQRARAEAAERGRLASREWAERQRLKTLATAQAKKVEAMAG